MYLARNPKRRWPPSVSCPLHSCRVLWAASSSVNRSVGEQRSELKTNPPQVERPTGAPQTKKGAGTGPEIVDGPGKGNVERTKEGQAKPTAAPKPLPEPPASPAAAVPEPIVAGTPKGEMSIADVSRMKGSINQMPTRIRR